MKKKLEIMVESGGDSSDDAFEKRTHAGFLEDGPTPRIETFYSEGARGRQEEAGRGGSFTMERKRTHKY